MEETKDGFKFVRRSSNKGFHKKIEMNKIQENKINKEVLCNDLEEFIFKKVRENKIFTLNKKKEENLNIGNISAFEIKVNKKNIAEPKTNLLKKSNTDKKPSSKNSAFNAKKEINLVDSNISNSSETQSEDQNVKKLSNNQFENSNAKNKYFDTKDSYKVDVKKLSKTQFENSNAKSTDLFNKDSSKADEKV